MGLQVILKHTKKLPDGRYRYRRRFPENARAELGWEYIRTSETPLSAAPTTATLGASPMCEINC